MPLFHLYKLLNSHKFIHNLESNNRLKLLKTVIAATLAATIIFANSFSLELPLNPIQNTLDINGNGFPDFFAFGNSGQHRSLHIFDITPEGLSEIWSFSLNENKNGYIADAILSDFDGDGNNEILAAIELENEPGKFYLFQTDGINFSPKPSHQFPYPDRQTKSRLAQLETIDWDNDGDRDIAVAMGSPNRSVIICDISDGKLKVMEKIADDFVKNTFGVLLFSSGDFDGDNIDDLIIINNGLEPSSYQYLSNSSPKEIGFGENGPILHVASPHDLNNDGHNDLLFLTAKGTLYSPVLKKPLILDSQSYSKINAHQNSLGKTIFFALSDIGAIQKFKLNDNLSLSPINIYSPPFYAENIQIPNILFADDNSKAIIFHNGENPEIALIELEASLDFNKQKRIDDREADIILGVEKIFKHPIEIIDNYSFSKFQADSLMEGLNFNLDSLRLDWTPTLNDLGFHELNYTFDMTQIGNLILNEAEGTVVTLETVDTTLSRSYLLYVNDSPQFDPERTEFIIVNQDTLNATFAIKDRNVDALLHVDVSTDQVNAKHTYSIPSPNTPFENDSDVGDSTAIKSSTDFSDIKKRESKFQWIPDVEPGEYSFTLIVNDLHNLDSLDIKVRVHPQILLNDNQQDFVLTVGRAFEYTMNVTQKNEAETDYDFEILHVPENMHIDAHGTIFWVPVVTQVDNHVITVQVSDGIALSSISLSFFVNDLPVVSMQPAKKINLEKGEVWEFTLGSFDANLTADISWRLLNAPHTMILDSLGNLRWMVNELDHQTYTVQISDGTDSTQFTNFLYSNFIPKITSHAITSVIWGNEYIYQMSAQDENQFSMDGTSIPNQLNYNLESSPNEMTIDDNGRIQWTPNEYDEGAHSIIVCVNDGLVDTKQKFTLLVEGPPAISSIDSLAVNPGDNIDFTISINNFNNVDILKYTGENLPSGLSINGETGHVFWNTSNKNIGLHTFSLSVENQQQESASMEMEIFVFTPPSINSVAPTEAYVGLTYTYECDIKDMFGDNLNEIGGSINISSETMDNIKFDDNSGNIVWSPKEADLGDHFFKVVAMDKFGLSSISTHAVSVFMSPCGLCKDENIMGTDAK